MLKKKGRLASPLELRSGGCSYLIVSFSQQASLAFACSEALRFRNSRTDALHCSFLATQR